MTDITKLADKWRNFKFPDTAETIGPLWEVGYIDCLGHLSDQLKAVLPVWTMVTTDRDTLPPLDMWVMRYRGGRLSADMGAWLNAGDWWRDITGYDRPPEQDDAY